MDTTIIKACLQNTFVDGEIHIEGDGRHFQVIVASDDFLGKTTVQQHQMVYQSLGESVGGDIHALSISTYTHAIWQKNKKLHGIQ